jgi:hypothetical protein
VPLVSRLIIHRKMIPSGVLYHNTTCREKHDFKLTALTQSDSVVKTNKGENKDDIGCCTADKREKGHICPASGRNNS